MTTRRALASLVLASACTAPDDPPGPLPEPAAATADLGDRAFRHVQTVVGFGPRDPGSPGWQKQLDYIGTQLADLGLEVQRDRWHDNAEDLTFENVWARLPGKTADRTILLCHHDTKATHGHDDPQHNFAFVGANDGGSGVGLMLALAAEIKRNGWHGETSLEFLFVDGEESRSFDWDKQRSLFGSRHYARQAAAAGELRRIRSVLVLDMVGARDLHIDDDDNTHRGMRRALLAAARATGAGAWFYHARNTVSDDHLPFLELGVPGAVLIDLFDNPQWHTPDDTLEHISRDSLQQVGRIVLTALPILDRLPSTR